MAVKRVSGIGSGVFLARRSVRLTARHWTQPTRALLLLLLACSHADSPTQTVTVTSVLVSSTSASLFVGETAQMSAALTDQAGATVAGQSVAWSSNNTSVIGVSASGVASALAVGSATVTATSGTASGSMLLSVSNRSAAGVQIVSGDVQQATVASALPAPLIVKVMDASGAALAGATVAWSAGAGSVSSANSTTDASGRAQTIWTLGTSAGSQNLSATVAALTPARFTATATAGAATQLLKVSGDAQVATVGQSAALPIIVRANDAYGNAVAGAAITWSVTTGGGSLGSAQAVTSASGNAQATWTLGTGAPPNAATARMAAQSAAFTATGTGGQDLGARVLFPADNAWNLDISASPVDPNSANLIASCGAASALHPDFGTVYAGAPNGIPFTIVAGSQGRVPVSFFYASESDPGPYPIPPNAPIEGGASSGGDRHVLVVDWDNWKLYELFDARPVNGGQSWTAGSGAVFDLNSNAQRPAGWTSADAAGLPILAGLVRYDEVQIYKAIRHALRFTCPTTRNKYVAPARHFASSNASANVPPMGMRVRLKASFDISHFSPAMQVILAALKRYGMFVADNGSGFFLSGAPDPRWDDTELHTLTGVHGSDFEVVRMGTLAP